MQAQCQKVKLTKPETEISSLRGPKASDFHQLICRIQTILQKQVQNSANKFLQAEKNIITDA